MHLKMKLHTVTYTAKAVYNTKLFKSASLLVCAFIFSGCSSNGLGNFLPKVYKTEQIQTEYFEQEIAYQKTILNPKNLIVFIDKAHTEYADSKLIPLFETTTYPNKLYFKTPCPNPKEKSCGFSVKSEKEEAIMDIIMAYSYPLSYRIYTYSAEKLNLKSFRVKKQIHVKDTSVETWLNKQQNDKLPWQK